MENNEVSGTLRANHVLIFITFYVPVEKTVFHNNKANADQRCYKRMGYGMASKKKWNKVKLTYLCIHLTYFLCWYDSKVSDGYLKLLEIAKTVLFVLFPTLNWFCLTQNLYFYLLLYLLLLVWILFVFERSWHNQSCF